MPRGIPRPGATAGEVAKGGEPPRQGPPLGRLLGRQQLEPGPVTSPQ